MHDNEILGRLADALSMDGDRLAAIFTLGGEELTSAEALGRTLKPDVDGGMECTPGQVARFLEGFIIEQRGPRTSGQAPPAVASLTNNAVLKKLRIALTLHEADMLRIFEAGGAPNTPLGLSPLFRKPGNKHYRPCSDRVLRSFLQGLAQLHQPEASQEE